MRQCGEDRLIGWLREHPGTGMLGDDTALLPGSPDGYVATVDSQIAGVHVPADLDAGVLAERLLQVSLSDVAATGATRPAGAGNDAPWCFALVTIAAPQHFDHRHFFSILLQECATSGVTLAGGDLATSPTLTATMTLIARPPEGWRRIRRSGARPGDVLWCGGTVGESAAGLRLIRRGARLTAHGERAHVFLPEIFRRDEAVAESARRAVDRHLRPRAQVELGAWLASLGPDEHPAALDLSDGLARDLPRLARESGVGAEVDAASLPLAGGQEEFGALCAALETDPVDIALAGGEDYVLLFAVPVETTPPEHLGCRPIGRVVEGDEITLVRGGYREPWPDMGWDHLDQADALSQQWPSRQ